MRDPATNGRADQLPATAYRDPAVCEALQASMRHSAYRRGAFSLFFDRAVARFQQSVIEATAAEA